MSVNTLVRDGVLHNIGCPVKIVPIDAKKGEVHYNPGLCRDPAGRVFVSIRSCITNYRQKYGITHPLGYENFLHVGILEESTLEIKGLKLIEPAPELTDYNGFQWGIEDIRLFWRDDGLHGVGVIIPVHEKQLKLRCAEILIDYEAGTYKLLKDLGRPFGHAEKNWTPAERPTEAFDYIYSPTQIVKKGKVIGEDNELFIHLGTPLIPYEDGYLSLGHAVCSVQGERTYAQIALKWDQKGRLIEHSQFFHFDVGWREGLRETIEFASGAIWSEGKEGEELLVGLGVKDEITGFCKIPMGKLQWWPYQDTMWYAWQYQSQPNRKEIDATLYGAKPYHQALTQT